MQINFNIWGEYKGFEKPEDFATFINNLDAPRNERKKKDDSEKLMTKEALEVKEQLVGAGMIDDDWQPHLSRAKAALLADYLSNMLNIDNRWVTFENLWGRANIRTDFNRAMNQKQTSKFLDELKRITVKNQ